MNYKLVKAAFRRTWTMSPVQKATPSKKAYKRTRAKREERYILQN